MNAPGSPEAPANTGNGETWVGVLGAGQLGRMLALAGYPMGLRFRFFDPAPDACAGQIAEHIVGNYNDQTALDRFSRGLDVVTYEFENVPVDSARFLDRRVPVYPTPAALEASQDRLVEKSLFQKLGIPTPRFSKVDTREELDAAIKMLGLPAVLKTRRMGYDGKGQAVLKTVWDVEGAWKQLAGRPLILESFVAFSRELSIIGVRGKDGETVFYPLVENHHQEGILRLSLAPAQGVSKNRQARAEEYANKVMGTLDYRGVLAIELFEVGNDLLANEMAPRVHNSGHWTIEGAETSQFENHLRAILGLRLGKTHSIGYSAMLNIIGELPDHASVLAVPGAHLHFYGKEPRPGRKLGHITLRADEASAVAERIDGLRSLVGMNMGSVTGQ